MYRFTNKHKAKLNSTPSDNMMVAIVLFWFLLKVCQDEQQYQQHQQQEVTSLSEFKAVQATRAVECNTRVKCK